MTTLQEKIEEYCNSLTIDIVWSMVDFSDVESADDIDKQLRDNQAFDVEVIYYHNAINYLSENDPSLQRSMEIAEELGYGPENLNSELLASLLASRELEGEWYDTQIDIQDEIDNLNDTFLN